eukprot:11914078-Alexandrium_andersonii.AAC.1
MHTADLAQEPLLLLPKAILIKKGFLGAMDLSTMPRNVLAPREKKEFMKLAQAVAKQPWDMVKANTWLNGWMEANDRGVDPSAVWPNFFWMEG